MLDIKLKNSNKQSFLLITIVIFICSIVMITSYSFFGDRVVEAQTQTETNRQALTSASAALIEGNYILFNEYSKETDRAYVLEQYGSSQFAMLRNYLDYEIFYDEKTPLLGEVDKDTVSDLLKKQDTPYACRIEFVFQDEGELVDIRVNSALLEKSGEYEMEQRLLEWQQGGSEASSISKPSNVTIVYGMTQDNLTVFSDNTIVSNDKSYYLLNNSRYIGVFMAMVFVLIVMTLIISLNPKITIKNLRIFRLPMEAAIFVLCTALACVNLMNSLVWYTINGEVGRAVGILISVGTDFIVVALNIAGWFLMFACVTWGLICLGAVFSMKGSYFKERVLVVRFVRCMGRGGNTYGSKMKRAVGTVYRAAKGFCQREYDKLLHMNFQKKTTRTILRIVGLNFIILLVVCSLWYVRIVALLIYSLLLFFFLQKYLSDIQRKYHLLLDVTSQLADGNLDIPIGGDMGIFNPVQEELKKIQSGFKKAVEEEVKSERMKTELITNVSHDLKTPLTAIITYTDLLKQEQDEEKRKEYISVLEKKSLRLKVLIEDLFEISKASSKNVTMNFVEVDIVDLLKQVGLEYEEKMKDLNLELRQSFPDHKIPLLLDSQKTYRIFENLLVNITKYAMPHTRVYVEMKELDNEVLISMKNISATELTFHSADITERFVRGDEARNTEGSGLGLAIAKSFTELQHGSLQIATEADLFKVEISLPKKRELVV